jgi:hypothetical protein
MPLSGTAGWKDVHSGTPCRDTMCGDGDGLSRREATKRFGFHRNTISKMLRFSVLQGYRRRERPASKKLGP